MGVVLQVLQLKCNDLSVWRLSDWYLPTMNLKKLHNNRNVIEDLVPRIIGALLKNTSTSGIYFFQRIYE
jgi:hypothetical protein